MNASNDNSDLLHAYKARGDDAAFAELVRRHVDLVFSAARRQLGGDADAAKDITQAVFCDLARKARRLPDGVVLAGWLHRHTGFLAANHIRAAHRRGQREHDAIAMQTLNQDAGPEWERLAPVLDAAIQELPEADLVRRGAALHTTRPPPDARAPATVRVVTIRRHMAQSREIVPP